MPSPTIIRMAARKLNMAALCARLDAGTVWTRLDLGAPLSALLATELSSEDLSRGLRAVVAHYCCKDSTAGEWGGLAMLRNAAIPRHYADYDTLALCWLAVHGMWSRARCLADQQAIVMTLENLAAEGAVGDALELSGTATLRLLTPAALASMKERVKHVAACSPPLDMPALCALLRLR